MPAKDMLGSQIWLEEHDTPQRVDELFAKAQEVGLGWVRLFLMWPWIQPVPDLPPEQWNWGLWDTAFDAAQRHGIQIKATLTANSGPWHWGTPSMLHSHTGLMHQEQWSKSKSYVEACVNRYHSHRALGQWILWNEPFDGGWESPAFLTFWRKWLAEHYGNDPAPLNRRWRTGYTSFEDIPRAVDVPHPAHKLASWNSSFPFLDEMKARQAWLIHQLQSVRDWVRAIDPGTPTCVNPNNILANRPNVGVDLESMAGLVDTLGASFHPSWHFTHAKRADFPGLIYAGVAALREIPGAKRVETSEVQTGNTADSGLVPNDARPEDIVKFHLAALAAGSSSVIGWCFNTRHHDNEAGDWALLDDQDQIGPRAAAMRRLHDRLEVIVKELGPLSPARPRVWVATDDTTQAYEASHGRVSSVNTPGRHTEDSARGAAAIVVECLRLGLPAATVPLETLAERLQAGDVAILSHLTAYDPALAEPLLSKVEALGATLVIDATTGRRDADLSMPRPWPGGFAEPLGLHTLGLESRDGDWPLSEDGVALLCRSRVVETDNAAHWYALSRPRFADGQPLAITRRLGTGRAIHIRAPLGPTLIHRDPTPWRALLAQLTDDLHRSVRPLDRDDVICLPMQAGNTEVTAVIAHDLDRVHVCAGSPLQHDYWAGHPLLAPIWGEQQIQLHQGCALLC